MENQSIIISDILHAQFNRVLKGKIVYGHFHCINAQEFSRLADNSLRSISSDYLFFYYQFMQTISKEPYQPFLKLIKQVVTEFNIEVSDLLERANVYPMHRCLFKSYIEDSVPCRRDEVILEELSYEVSQLQRSLAGIILELSKNIPLVIMISDLQYADNYTLDFIQAMKKYLVKGNILFLFTYNKNYYFSNEDQQELWSNFTTFAEENYSIFDVIETSSVEDAKLTASADLVSLEEALRLSLLHVSFLTYKEAIKCALKALEIAKKSTEFVKPELYYAILEILGNSFYYLGENVNAITYYRMFLDEAHKSNNSKMISEGYRKLALAHLNKYDMDTAVKLADQSQSFAEMSNDEFQTLKVYYLLYLISAKTAQPMEKYKYFTLLELLLKYKLENTYAHCLKNVYSYADHSPDLHEFHYYCDLGIAISTKNQNELSLSIDYHKKGILYSYVEDYESTLYYYTKSKDLRLKIGDPLNLIQIFNGMGYLNMINGKYKDAIGCFKRSISLLSKIQDYNEISITICNYAFLQFLCRNYKACIKTVDKLLQILKIYNMAHLPFRSISDIYILKAFCCFKIGENLKTLDLLNRAENLGILNLTSDFKFLYYILKGLIAANESQHDVAINYFEDSITKLDSLNHSSRMLLPIYYIEYGSALLSMGKADCGVKVLSDGIDFCSTYNFSYYHQLMEKALTGTLENKSNYPLPKINLNLEALVEIAKQNVNLNKLHKKIREIEFINKLQELSSASNSKSVICEKYLDLLHMNYPVEIAYLHLIEGQQSNCLASKSTADINFEVPFEYINELILRDEPILLNYANTPCSDYNIQDFKFIINIPVKVNKFTILNLFLATTKTQNSFTEDDLNVLLISMKQMAIILAKVDQENTLYQLASTDPLTGLKNRQALNSAMKTEFIKGEYYKDNGVSVLSLIFIDLDNFKYYNDTFGHSLGDIIIKSFAGLLKENFRKTDFIARLGGDEFVIILPETNKDKAKYIAERLLNKLAAQNHFIDIISEYLGRPVTIPKDKILTCSIGIADNQSNSGHAYNVEDLMNHADQAQYKAKSSGKNTVVLY